MAASRIAAILACLILAGCGADGSDTAGSYEQDADTGTITASAPMEGGEATMLAGPAIAAPLPIDIPIMPGAEVTLATHVSTPDGLRIALVEMTSDQSPEQLAAFYRVAASEAGLNPALDLEGGDAVTFIAIGQDRSRMTLHAGTAVFLEDGTRAPVPPEDAEDSASDAEDAPATRSATAAQLYIIGSGADPAPAS